MRGRFSSLEELSTDVTRAIQHMKISVVLNEVITFPNVGTRSLRKRETILKDCEHINLKEIKVLVKKYRVHYI